MQVELVRVQTCDGLRLDGVLQVAAAEAESSPAVDAVICVHGVGGNFYGSSMLEHLSSVLSEEGVSVLRINTRGHDGVSTASTAEGGRLQGSAYEIVDECRHDLRAWIEYLQSRGCQRIVLLGHSLGAIKVIYAQALQSHPSVTRVIAISPPRLAHEHFLRGRDAEAFHDSLDMAQRWIDADQPRMLFHARFPFPLILSAATFMDKYGPHERYNYLRLAPRVRTPLDFVFGQVELAAGSSAFDGLVNDVESASWSAPVTVNVIPGANHFYVDRMGLLIDRICLQVCEPDD